MMERLSRNGRLGITTRYVPRYIWFALACICRERATVAIQQAIFFYVARQGWSILELNDNNNHQYKLIRTNDRGLSDSPPPPN